MQKLTQNINKNKKTKRNVWLLPCALANVNVSCVSVCVCVWRLNDVILQIALQQQWNVDLLIVVADCFFSTSWQRNTCFRNKEFTNAKNANGFFFHRSIQKRSSAITSLSLYIFGSVYMILLSLNTEMLASIYCA